MNTIAQTVPNLRRKSMIMVAKAKETFQDISTKKVVIILSSLMLLVAAIAYFGLLRQSLRLDEAQSLWQSSHSAKEFLHILAQDVHVPLYGLMLHFWEVLFGNDIYTARLLSLVFFIASIPASYFLGKTAFNKQAGLIAATLVATSPFLNWYGSETRMYSMFLFFAIVNQTIFLKIFQAKAKDASNDQKHTLWILYALTSLLGMYTHYFFGFVLLVQALFFFMYRSEFHEHAFRNFILTAIFLGLCFSPWLYYVRSLGSASNTQPFLTAPTTTNIFNTFSQFLFGFQDDHLNTMLVSLWPLTVLFGFLSLGKKKHIPAESIYFFMSAILPIALAFIVSVTFRPLFLTRYLIIAAPSLYLFMVWMLQTYPKNLRNALTAILIIAMVATLSVQTTSAATPVKENYRQASEYLTAHATTRDVVAVSAPFTIYPIEYYYKGQAELITLPEWDRFTIGPMPTYSDELLEREVTELKKDHDTIYIALSYDQGYEQKIKYYFDTHFSKIDEQHFSNDLNVYVYKLNQSYTFDSLINAKSSYSSPFDIVSQ